MKAEGSSLQFMNGCFNKAAAEDLFVGSFSRQQERKSLNSFEYFSGLSSVGDGLDAIKNNALIGGSLKYGGSL